MFFLFPLDNCIIANYAEGVNPCLDVLRLNLFWESKSLFYEEGNTLEGKKKKTILFQNNHYEFYKILVLLLTTPQRHLRFG